MVGYLLLCVFVFAAELGAKLRRRFGKKTMNIECAAEDPSSRSAGFVLQISRDGLVHMQFGSLIQSSVKILQQRFERIPDSICCQLIVGIGIELEERVVER